MTAQEEAVQARLKELGIAFTRHEHPPVATVDEAAQHWAGIDATHCKNLFLRNQKGNRHYLVVLEHLKKADLRAVADQIGDGKLSFASPERLMTHLGLTPGSVSPFGLINNQDHAVRLVRGLCAVRRSLGQSGSARRRLRSAPAPAPAPSLLTSDLPCHTPGLDCLQARGLYYPWRRQHGDREEPSR